MEKRWGARISFQDSKIIFAPFPILFIENPHLSFVPEKFSELTAREVRLSLKTLPLFWGQVRLSGFEIREGEGVFGPIPLKQIHFKVKGLGSKGPAPFEGRAQVADGKEGLRAKGKLSFQNSGENLWRELGLKGEVQLKGLSLKEGIGKDLLKFFPSPLTSGELQGTLHVEKQKGTGLVTGLAEFQVKDFQTGASEAFPLEGQAKISWNFENNSTELKEVVLKTPFGELEGVGIFNGETGEIEEARLNGRKLILEELVRHFPSIHSALPLDMGFSGESEFDLTLRGSWDYLSLHANWNLAPAVLTYGNFFSKPKDLPLSVNFDFLLKEGSLVSGDFSVRIQQMTMKGTLARLDLKNGQGELTLLSNKFDLLGWETLLVPFASYNLSGSAKLLLSLKGDLTHLSQAERMTNLTLENVSLLSPTGRGIRNTSLLLDVSPLSFRIKKGVFEVGNSSLQTEIEIYNLKEHPEGTIRFTSPHLEPQSLLDNLKAFPLGSLPWRKIRQGMDRFLPRSFSLENLSLQLKIQQEKWVLEAMKFQAFEGEARLQGERTGTSEKPSFWLGVTLERIPLARYLEELRKPEKILEGNLFLKGKFQGTGKTEKEIFGGLKGEGSVSLTNGEWHGLPLHETLRSLEFLKSLAGEREASLAFSDLKANWKLGEEKFETDDLLIHSQDVWCEGEGSLTLKGVLNSRLDVYLSPSLTEKVFDAWGSRGDSEGKQLGPIPVLVVGSLKKPEARIDERSMEPFLQAVQSRRYRKILHRPFKESQQP